MHLNPLFLFSVYVVLSLLKSRLFISIFHILVGLLLLCYPNHCILQLAKFYCTVHMFRCLTFWFHILSHILNILSLFIFCDENTEAPAAEYWWWIYKNCHPNTVIFKSAHLRLCETVSLTTSTRVWYTCSCARQLTGTPRLMQQLHSVRYSTSPILHNSEFSTHMVKNVCIQMWAQLKFKLQNTRTWSVTAWLPHWLCYHPAVFFCHMSLHFHCPKKNSFFTF